jgi:hypothetical protein
VCRIDAIEIFLYFLSFLLTFFDFSKKTKKALIGLFLVVLGSALMSRIPALISISMVKKQAVPVKFITIHKNSIPDPG